MTAEQTQHNLVIAEKPSVARSIVAVFGADEKQKMVRKEAGNKPVRYISLQLLITFYMFL